MKLKQYTTITVGYPFREKIAEVVRSGILAVQMKDVSVNEGIYWSNCIETELPGKREPDWLLNGDILFTARGSKNYAVLVDKKLIGRKAVASPHFYVIRCKNTELLPEYLVWLINQNHCQRYFKREAEGSFTKSIRRSVLEETPIAIPSISKQRSIIHLANFLKEKKMIFEKLTRNYEILMNTIANDLLKETK
jgi:restriction endonuclease S subunit